MSDCAEKILLPEITESILVLLPPKSLCRFKSVSKTWNSLISKPRFIKNHLHQNNNHQTTKLILVSGNRSLYSVDINETLPYLNNNNNTDDYYDDDEIIPATGKEVRFRSPPIQWDEILGSCNGLVLARDEKDTMLLINPTTQHLWEVPISNCQPPKEDDQEFLVRIGFGYDSTTDDYKIVSILFIYVNQEHRGTFVTVYSLRNNSWKFIDFPSDHAVIKINSGAFVNQSFHWLVNTSTILAFSFANEEFSEIKMEFPDSFENSKAWYYDLLEIGGKLGVFWRIRDGTELWVMEEYGNGKSWAKVFSRQFREPFSFIILGAGSGRDLVLEDEGEVVVYNIDEGRCITVKIDGGPDGIAYGGTYVETIESPKRFITTP